MMHAYRSNGKTSNVKKFQQTGGRKRRKRLKPNYKHIYSRSNESHKNQKTYKH